MSLRAYAFAVDQIYAASVNPEAWGAAMEAIRRGFEASVVAFVAAAPSYRPIMANAGLPDEARASYEEYYGRIDHVAKRFQRRATGLDEALPGGAFAPPEERRRSEFFRDWALPVGMGHGFVAGTAFWRADAINWLAVVGHPDQSRIEDDDNVRSLRLLLPHIRRAADLQTRMEDGPVQFASATDVLAQLRHAVALLRDGGTLSYVNPAGEVLLANRDGLWIDHAGALHASRTADEAALRRLIWLATRGDDLGVRTGGRLLIAREASRLPLLLYIVPTNKESSFASAMAIAVDPQGRATISAADMQEIFGLTRAEADTARRVVCGLGLQRVADEAGVTLSTVRVQLQRVFEKTGTHRQAELVRLVDSLQAGIH